eukprot:7564144-Alexandrium_andersonii.AAC.1
MRGEVVDVDALVSIIVERQQLQFDPGVFRGSSVADIGFSMRVQSLVASGPRKVAGLDLIPPE